MGSSHQRNYTLTAEPGIDWNKVVDTIETIAASSFIQIEKGGDGTTAWAYVHTYKAPFDKDDVAKVMAAHPEITKMIRSSKGKPDDSKLQGFYGTPQEEEPKDPKKVTPDLMAGVTLLRIDQQNLSAPEVTRVMSEAIAIGGMETATKILRSIRSLNDLFPDDERDAWVIPFYSEDFDCVCEREPCVCDDMASSMAIECIRMAEERNAR